MRKENTLNKVRKSMVKEHRTFKHSKNRKKKEKWARLLSLKQRRKQQHKHQEKKRMQSRVERDKKPQMKAIRAKVGTQKLKEKTHPEITATQT